MIIPTYYRIAFKIGRFALERDHINVMIVLKLASVVHLHQCFILSLTHEKGHIIVDSVENSA